MTAKKLNESFFNRSARIVAPELLGNILVFETGKKLIKCRVVETEAYLGEVDKASHAYKGRTARTEVMYQRPGSIYVYMIYGMYFMLNLVCHREGIPHAVLIRAAECLTHPELKLDGPGKLCRELGITKKLNALHCEAAPLYFLEAKAPFKITRGPRIGIDYAEEWKNKKLRYYDALSRSVSKLPRLKA